MLFMRRSVVIKLQDLLEVSLFFTLLFGFIVLVPPLLFALSYPEVFFKALSFAGGICAMILFGILPVAMAWIGRYKKEFTSCYHVKGGKLALIIALAFALLVISCEVAHIFS